MSQFKVVKKQSIGFTLVEVMIVIVIFSIIMVLTLGTFAGYVKRQQFKTEVNDVERSINEQKTKAITSLNDSAHGFYISSSFLVTFSGMNYMMGASGNKVTSFRYMEATTSISFMGVPTTTIYFNKRTGEASATGTIKLLPLNGDVGTSTITIYESGLIKYSQ